MTPRYLRHFSLLYIIDFDDSTLGTVFETIVDWWVRSRRLSNDVSRTEADFTKPSIKILVLESNEFCKFDSISCEFNSNWFYVLLMLEILSLFPEHS